MKSKLMLVVFGVCFSLFLFLGIRASQAMFPGGENTHINGRPTSGPVLIQQQPGEPLPLDPFTLIVLVDDLNASNPLLEGVWLSRSTDGGAGNLFFPIFPSQADDGVQRDLNLRGAFWLEEAAEPSQQFLTILADRNLSWHQILLLDLAALGEMGVLLSEQNPEFQSLNAVGLAGLAYNVENRLIVQGNQALFINDLCKQLPLPAQNELLQRFLEGFANHLQLSGTTTLAFAQSWQGTSYCLFPTMTLPGQ